MEVAYFDVDIDPDLDLDPQPLIDLSRRQNVVAGRNGMFGGVPIPDNFVLNDPNRDMYLALSYAGAKQVLSDDENFSAHQAYAHTLGAVWGDVLLTLDRPGHTRSRQLTAKAFLHRNVQGEWQVQHVLRVIHQLIDGFADRGKGDLVQLFTAHFPFEIICGIIGVPAERRDEFSLNAHAILNMLRDLEGAQRGAEGCDAITRDLMADLRVRPRPCMLLDLMDAEFERERLSEEEICRFVRFLLPAGLDTTARSTANLLYFLLSNDLIGTVAADRSLVGSAMEESLRMIPVGSMLPRIARRDIDVDGTMIPAGSAITACTLTGNRDQKVFADPDRFDIRRPRKPLLSFGGGIHSCLGVALARAELKAAFEAILDRLPNLRPNPEHWHYVRVRGLTLRTVDSLPVVWDPS
ncbi:MAG: cytochrome P450 [Sphingomonadaceae bacterium]